MNQPKISACGHERALFELKERDELIADAVAVLKTWSSEFDAIAVSGYSSAMSAPIIAHTLRKNIVLVRKESEQRNSYLTVEGIWGQRVLFFDDLVSSGRTLERIRDGLTTIECRIVGFYLYKQTSRDLTYIVPGIVNMQEPRVTVQRKINPIKTAQTKLSSMIAQLDGSLF